MEKSKLEKFAEEEIKRKWGIVKETRKNNQQYTGYYEALPYYEGIPDKFYSTLKNIVSDNAKDEKHVKSILTDIFNKIEFPTKSGGTFHHEGTFTDCSIDLEKAYEFIKKSYGSKYLRDKTEAAHQSAPWMNYEPDEERPYDRPDFH